MVLTENEIAIKSEESRSGGFGDLQLFKMLLQPHFLFNSLNNLYSLSVQQSDKTADAIAGLSEMLEKVVSCSRQEMISLSKEIALIRDYLKLEEIWLGAGNMLVDLKVSGDTDNYNIPPLVLYTFIENCFKHGIRKCNGQGWLKARVTAKDDVLTFSSRNMIPEWEQNVVCPDQHKGFGIVAVKKILEKNYKNNFSLQYRKDKNTYCVDLAIEFNK